MDLGLTYEELTAVRLMEPKERLLEAAKLALKVDDEPNSDFIEFIAGYEARSALYHYFRNAGELLNRVSVPRLKNALQEVRLGRSELDLTKTIPDSIQSYALHMEDSDHGKKFIVWQKLNGGMRSAGLNRVVPRVSFLTGILLYAGEGTKSLATGRVEIANSSPNILRLFVRFLTDLGIAQERLKARIQIHDPSQTIDGTRH